MIRINNKRVMLLCLFAGLAAGCSSSRIGPAPVVDYRPAAKSADVAKPAIQKPPEGRGYYIVKRGDTLYRIALEFGQNYQDLVTWNNLASASDIKVDQTLRVLPPEGAVVSTGVQTGSVASASGVEVRPLSTGAPPVMAPLAQGATTGSVTTKTGPRADKRPYSENALTELQKPDAMIVAPVKTEVLKTPEIKPADKLADPVAGNAEDEGIAWMWPTDGKVISGFDDGKKGIDIAGKPGQEVLAAGAGKVMYAGSGIRGYGNLVIVKHTNNLLSAYAHNRAIVVKEGQAVTRGQKIAEMGNSDSDAVKLHFEIRQQGKPVDPAKFLPNR